MSKFDYMEVIQACTCFILGWVLCCMSCSCPVDGCVSSPLLSRQKFLSLKDVLRFDADTSKRFCDHSLVPSGCVGLMKQLDMLW